MGCTAFVDAGVVVFILLLFMHRGHAAHLHIAQCVFFDLKLHLMTRTR